ncbi:hypothetical protein N007_05850 [Alicyclobacillus acidoterrestris ATCC 49025]|nr:hypothetical protein N007_05850 [Alicyclobacillus acidoterrestris ATCC 49025]
MEVGVCLKDLVTYRDGQCPIEYMIEGIWQFKSDLFV